LLCDRGGEYLRPGGARLRGEVVAEDVQPAADQLGADAVVVHPRQPPVDVGQAGIDRAGPRSVVERHPEGFLVSFDPHAGNGDGAVGEVGQQPGGQEVGMDVDAAVSSHGFSCARSAAQMSLGLMGRECRGGAPAPASASLTAEATAAGAPMYPDSPTPFWPNDVNGDGVQCSASTICGTSCADGSK